MSAMSVYGEIKARMRADRYRREQSTAAQAQVRERERREVVARDFRNRERSAQIIRRRYEDDVRGGKGTKS